MCTMVHLIHPQAPIHPVKVQIPEVGWQIHDAGEAGALPGIREVGRRVGPSAPRGAVADSAPRLT